MKIKNIELDQSRVLPVNTNKTFITLMTHIMLAVFLTIPVGVVLIGATVLISPEYAYIAAWVSFIGTFLLYFVFAVDMEEENTPT